MDHVAFWRENYSAVWYWGGIKQEAYFKVNWNIRPFVKILGTVLLAGRILINVFHHIVGTGSVFE